MLAFTLVLALAPPTGAYSGVSLDNLLETPLPTATEIVAWSAAELIKQGTGLTAAPDDPKLARITGREFALEVPFDGEPGTYTVVVQCGATSSGNDSFWVELDGVRDPTPFTMPVGAVAAVRFGLSLTTAGRHTVKLVLREGTGAAIQSVAITTVTIRTGRPAVLPERAASHPRLYLTAAELPALRERLAGEAGKRFYALAGPPSSKPPAYSAKGRSTGGYRSLASAALAQALQPDPARLERILLWLRTALTFEEWGHGSLADLDLDAEYMMEGLALTYDWLHDQLPEDLRAQVRETIADHCRILFRASLAGRTGGSLQFQQNHYWFAHLALALGAAAVHGEVPEAEGWLTWAWDRFERVFLTLSDDGGFHEGPGYYDYSMPTLFQMISLYEQLTGLRIPYGDAGLAKSAAFRFQYLYPSLQRSASLEDSSGALGRPPAFIMLWLAKRFTDPVAQGIAELVSAGPLTHWANLLYLDPALRAEDPLRRIPTGHWYRDVETAFLRTSWAPEATYVAFVSRPLGGHLYAELCARYNLSGTGHNHPEQNHFVLFARGQELADDPGYTYEKRTANHNTILVDGKGQYGDGEMWPRPNAGRAFLRGFTSAGEVGLVTGEAASAYPAELGLKRFERTLALLGPELVVIHDTLEADAPHTFQWRQHFQGSGAVQGDGFKLTVGDAACRVLPLLPAGVTGKLVDEKPQFVHPTRNLTPENPVFQVLELSSPAAARQTFLVVLSIGAPDGAAPAVERLDSPTGAGVKSAGWTIWFRTGPAPLQPPGGQPLSAETVAVVIKPDGTRIEHRLER